MLTADFQYEKDKNGNSYGWGVARYATPEQFYGPPFCEGLYACKPQQSYDRLLSHLHSVLPDVSEDNLKRLLG